MIFLCAHIFVANLCTNGQTGAAVLSDLGEGQSRSPLARMMSKDPDWPQSQHSAVAAAASSNTTSTTASAASSSDRKKQQQYFT